MKSQEQWILEQLQQGKQVTPIDALNGCGCFRLGARIFDLKQKGHNIFTEKFKTPSGKTVARYRLIFGV
ncbi:Helix-turn-helix domain containing protein [uncultured Caudovirales phage]|uniref:Helix-turn-helix domain containing protein n=1 Tax=uncultured Caudovirales phage TaxID=2100421 RepID=A0A6J5PB55_9CAUD|nr:Helix-turn-helix domain containing protein [uncultured Caudovirales phage]